MPGYFTAQERTRRLRLSQPCTRNCGGGNSRTARKGMNVSGVLRKNTGISSPQPRGGEFGDLSYAYSVYEGLRIYEP